MLLLLLYIFKQFLSLLIVVDLASHTVMVMTTG
jgi:hypothetical protein